MVWDKISNDSIPYKVQENLQQSRWKWGCLINGSRDNEDAEDQEAHEDIEYICFMKYDSEKKKKAVFRN